MVVCWDVLSREPQQRSSLCLQGTTRHKGVALRMAEPFLLHGNWHHSMNGGPELPSSASCRGGSDIPK